MLPLPFDSFGLSSLEKPGPSGMPDFRQHPNPCTTFSMITIFATEWHQSREKTHRRYFEQLWTSTPSRSTSLESGIVSGEDGHVMCDLHIQILSCDLVRAYPEHIPVNSLQQLVHINSLQYSIDTNPIDNRRDKSTQYRK